MLDHTDKNARQEGNAEGQSIGRILHDAPAMRFRYAAADQTKTQALFELVEAKVQERRKRRMRANDRQALRTAVEAIAGELIAANDWMYYTTRHDAYTGRRVSYRQATAAMDALVSLGLVDRIAGNNQKREAFEVPHYERRAPRVRATQGLRDRLQDVGFKIEWQKTPPKSLAPLIIRSQSAWGEGGKHQGRDLELPDTEQARRLTQDILDLNKFIGRIDVKGCDAPAWQRIFVLPDGVDVSTYAFDLGGRLYAPYQSMRKEDRDKITFGDEPTIEVDVRASHLTILHHWKGLALDTSPDADPYLAVPRLISEQPVHWRGAVKAYITMLLGKGRQPERWSDRAIEKHTEAFAVQLPPIKMVAYPVLRTYPLLRSPDDPLLWAKLQYAESEAMMHALGDLARSAVPALPVHDALRVPVSGAKLAIRALTTGYAVCGCGTPHIR